MPIDLPYRAEYTTKRNGCKTCRSIIARDTIQIGIMKQVSSLDNILRILISNKREISFKLNQTRISTQKNENTILKLNRKFEKKSQSFAENEWNL